MNEYSRELNVEMYRERQQRRHEEESWLRQQVEILSNDLPFDRLFV